ncbi:peptidylprolyl isomerase [Sinorhizobium americanum]|uniref:Periplasmic chaperone for outer membrane proteins SurA n=1 Tax=Sinorhizobium americanum TaxID=194963 RepID=A0A1L3LKF0_9HYPH|nr:peptidylprolyl isomerase [Sinorhizobium americanum]APG83975.1 survival protein SurA, peptidyl-prolyl cis-trans isomerase protein [Sinorhizobium americanum CCGM7]APG90526.1 survival protein SurA, peptidyl-prolyl cis-trans isomerase protein [Sinorhizobium americanum]OAP48136.1 molecular chaperone SurA [Sinorhizobium americanum]TCN30917.1 periplasmic chaperone for outer membrane proteins SurA [Sinorhizobium americanum]
MMGGKFSIVKALSALAVAGVLSIASGAAVQAASGVSVIVNNTVITSGDIAKRVAFLRLQRQGGGAAEAKKQLVDEVLKRAEIARVQQSVSTQEVDAAYARFAAGNKLSAEQLGKILDQSGVGMEHFKQYIAVQMSWPRVVNFRYGSATRLSGGDLVKRMMEGGGDKPVTTEYFLQQVIFVIPEKKRGAITAKRQAEANASRAKFPGCETSKVFAANYRDVSIRSLGRVLAQQLPEDWKPLVEKAGDGMTTGTRVTEKGVEYLAICKKRQVNDDAAAEVVFRAEDIGKKKAGGEDPNSEKYLEELRSKAQIVNK